MGRPRPWMQRLVLLALVVAGAWEAAGLRPFTWTDRAAVAGLAAYTLILSRRRIWRPPDAVGRGPLTVAGVLAWIGVAVAVAGWELLEEAGTPRDRHPTLSSMTDPLIDPHHRWLRAAAELAWVLLGLFLLRPPKRTPWT